MCDQDAGGCRGARAGPRAVLQAPQACSTLSIPSGSAPPGPPSRIFPTHGDFSHPSSVPSSGFPSPAEMRPQIRPGKPNPRLIKLAVWVHCSDKQKIIQSQHLILPGMNRGRGARGAGTGRGDPSAGIRETKPKWEAALQDCADTQQTPNLSPLSSQPLQESEGQHPAGPGLSNPHKQLPRAASWSEAARAAPWPSTPAAGAWVQPWMESQGRR